MQRRSSSSRWKVVTGVAAYIAAFIWAYLSFLNPVWGYWGFTNSEPSGGQIVLVCCLAMIPALWLPIRLARPSQFVLWAVFICIVVPSIIVPLYAAKDGQPVMSLIVAIVAAFALMSVASSLPLWPLPNLKLRPRTFWGLLGVISALLTIDIYSVYGGHLRLVSFANAYDLRFQSREIDAGFAGYAVWWLAYAIDPLLMAYALIKKQRLLFALGAVGQLFVYSTSAMRSVMVLVIVLPGLYVLLRRKTDRIGPRIAWTAAFVTSAAAVLSRFAETASLSTMVLFRTLGIPGLMSYDFYNFFSARGYTYWSHVRFISRFITYPYDLQIPYLIGREYYGNEAVSANAHFMATDGIAAAGIPGLLFIAILTGLVLYVIDLLAKRHDRLFLLLLLAGPMIALLNVGLFTTLLTDGLAVLIVLLTLMPPVRRGDASWTVHRVASSIPRSALSR